MSVVGSPAAVPGDDAAEDDPVAVVRAGRVLPPTRQHEPALFRHRPAVRGVWRRRPGVGVGAVTSLLHALVVQCDLPRMNCRRLRRSTPPTSCTDRRFGPIRRTPAGPPRTRHDRPTATGGSRRARSTAAAVSVSRPARSLGSRSARNTSAASWMAAMDSCMRTISGGVGVHLPVVRVSATGRWW